MPIVNPSPLTPVLPQPDAVRVTSPEYRGVTVDTRYTPASALLTHIDGASWTVNYYSQVLNVDNNVDSQSIDRAPAYQQYKLIKQLELKVTDGLNFSQESDSKVVEYSGEALVYPFLIPNIGDMFLADIGDGREAVFQVTDSVQKSMYTQTCYSITYRTVDYSTNTRRKDLDAKTVETYQFVRDFYQSGQNPLVLASDYANLLDLGQAYAEILLTWSQEFFSNEFSTWVIPGQTYWCYDSFMVTAMMACYTTTDTPQIRNVRARVVDGDDQMHTPTIWDVMLTRNLQTLRIINERMGLASVKLFSPEGMMESIRYSGFNYVVYPLNARFSWDQKKEMTSPAPSMLGNYNPGYPNPTGTYTLINVPPRQSRLSVYIPNPELAGLPYEGLPLIKPVLVDDYYIFSEAFYSKDSANQSRLEAAVWDYLLGNDLDLKLLNALIQSYQSWGALERFYYTPIVLMLIKANIRSI